jgi:hypothetical protein
MDSELPEGLRSDVRETITPILEAARKAGWSFSSIHWASKGSRTVGFYAKSPSGGAVHGLCSESNFSERLKVLLDSN